MKNLLFPFLLLSACSALAQELKPKAELAHAKLYFSELMERESGSSVSEYVGRVNENLITYSSEKELDYFVRYDADMKPVSKVTLDQATLMEKKQVFSHHGFVQLTNGSIIRLFGITDHKEGVNTLYATVFNTDEMKHGETTKIWEIKGREYFADMHNTFLGFDISPNGQHIALVNKMPRIGEELVKIRVVMMDGVSFSKKWEKDVLLDQPNGRIKIGGKSFVAQTVASGVYIGYDRITDVCAVDNEGTLFTTLSLDKGREAGEEGRFSQVLFGVNQKEELKHDLNGMAEVRSFVAEDKGILGVGSCNTDNSGCVRAIIWDGKNEPVVVDNEISEEEYFRGMSSKVIERTKKDSPVPDFRVDNEKYRIHRLSNGDAIILGLPDRFYSNGSFYHGQQYVGRISAEGKLLWETKLFYLQDPSATGDALGELSFVSGNKLYVLFSASKENSSESWTPERGVVAFAATLGNPVMMVTIDLDDPSNRTREKLWIGEQAGGFFRPSKKVWKQNKDGSLDIYILGAKKTERIISVVPKQ